MSIIPITTISAQQELVENQLIDAISELILRKQYVGGPLVAEFEQQFATYCGTQYAIGTNSGTTALQAVLSTLQLHKNDEVITTPMSFCATADAIVLAGGKPVFADVDPKTGNVDPKKVAQKITKKTRAIVVVHLYGVPADMQAFRQLAKQHNLLLVEDASHAHGTKYQQHRVGSLGDAGCFSLYPSKIIGGVGNAGVITTNDAVLAAQVRSFCHHGQSATAKCLTGERYVHNQQGITGGMDELSAAALLLKLPLLDGWIAQRWDLAQKLNQHLLQLSQKPMTLPREVASLYTFAFKTKNRQALITFLYERGIEARVYYPKALHLQPSYKQFGYRVGDFPIAEQWAESIISLPLYQSLSESEVKVVCDALTGFFAKK